MTTRREEGCVPYIGLNIGLHSCVKEPNEFLDKLLLLLKSELNPDYDSDINVEITESAGWEKKENGG